jgi:APA family basic amino acid/polyamine antiporter
MLSFVIAGTVCAFAALAYAELASMLPVAGSAYTYAYAVMGEFIAWLVGWNLILEYAVSAAAVAVGWSGYIVGLLESMHIEIPLALKAGKFATPGGGLNVIATLLVIGIAGLLVFGTRASARFNAVLVIVKVVALVAFVAVALPQIEWAYFRPFMPFGFGSSEVEGLTRGVMAAAALVFFAYVGFDAVSTAAEETANPNRNVPLGLIGSLVICTLIYVLVAASAVGTTPYTELAASTEPLAFIMRNLGYQTLGNLIGVAAIIALPTVVLTMLFGQARIFFVMSRDGLLPEVFSRIHPRLHTPHVITAATAFVVAVIAGLYSVDEIAELSNSGTLFAFIAVAIAVLLLRQTEPERPRPFRCPAVWFVGPAAIAGCLYLMWSLPRLALGRFVVWTLFGALVYFGYGYRRSPLRDQRPAPR